MPRYNVTALRHSNVVYAVEAADADVAREAVEAHLHGGSLEVVVAISSVDALSEVIDVEEA